MTDVIVKAENLSKCFKIYEKPFDRIAEWLSFGKVCKHDNFWALRNVSFEIKRGECLGIVGPNGAGKSTLLKILSRAVYPTSGSFEIKGRAFSILELGTGFNLELTGRKNVYNSAQLLGIPTDFINENIGSIEDFAEIGEFFDHPVKLYSSGMLVRLAFSMFVTLKPDLFIIDEALAVGDIFFVQKCFRKIEEIINDQVSLLLVSHDICAVERFCKKALVLNQGEVEFLGKQSEALRIYVNLKDNGAVPDLSEKTSTSSLLCRNDSAINETELPYPEPNDSAFVSLNGKKVYKYGAAGECVRFALYKEDGAKADLIKRGEKIFLLCDWAVKADVPYSDSGFLMFNRMGVLQYGISLTNNRHILPDVKANTILRAYFSLEVDLEPGEYTINIVFGNKIYSSREAFEFFAPEGGEMISEVQDVCSFNVLPCDGNYIPHYGPANLNARSKYSLIS